MSESERFLRLLKDRIEAHGTSERRFEDDFGLPKWSLRGILDKNRKQAPSIDKAKQICDALGLAFYIGPKDTAQAAGFSEPPAVFELDEPKAAQFILLDPLPGDGIFFVQPAFRVLQDLDAGTYCMVEPAAPLRPGGLIYIENHRGEVNIGRYHGTNDQDWPIVHTHGGEMVSEWNPDHVTRILPITWTGWTPPPWTDPVIRQPDCIRELDLAKNQIADLQGKLDRIKEVFRP